MRKNGWLKLFGCICIVSTLSACATLPPCGCKEGESHRHHYTRPKKNPRHSLIKSQKNTNFALQNDTIIVLS